MRRDKLPDDLRLSEAQLRSVIELATRVPPRSEGVSLADLRQIAEELDIDQDALASALAVVLAQPSPPRPRRAWLSRLATRLGRLADAVLPRKGRLVVLGMVGGLFGWVDAWVSKGLHEVINGMTLTRGSTSYLVVRLVALLILLTLANLLSRRLDGRRVRYLAETVVTWGAMVVAWSVTMGYLTMDGLRFSALCVAVFGLWGWLLIRPRGGAHPLPMEAQPGSLPQTAPDPLDRESNARSAWRWLLSTAIPR